MSRLGAGYVLGIDLGTTFTAAAVHRDGRTAIATLGNRAPSVPTLVFLRDDQVVLTGEAAERRGTAEPQRLAREFKRRVGDSAPIMLGEAPYSAERLMAAVVRQVVAAVAEREGGEPDRVAVSHPANWGAYKVDLMRHAVDLAGLRDAVLLTEPVAAAMHYASAERVEVGSVIAVYDLGGGTFDAAVLRKTPTGFETLGEPEGIERLGGIDFDEAVMAHVRRSLGSAIDDLDAGDPTVRAALTKLRQECVAAKEALSFDSETTISVLLPNVQRELRLTRAELEPMIRPALAETIEALRRAIERSGVGPDDLDSILLVGGSSQIPLVAEVVSTGLGRPVAVDAHPKHSVALGAALAASAATAAPNAVAPPPPPPPTPPAPAGPPPTSSTADGALPPSRLAPVALAAPAGGGGGAGAVPPSPQPPGAPGAGGSREGRGRSVLVAAVVLAVVALAVGAWLLTKDGDDGGEAQAGATTTSTTTAPDGATTTSTGGDAGTTTTTGTPTCASASGRCSAITGITIEGGRYVASYAVAGFDPLIFDPGVQGTADDHHVHFFFDTTAPENAGTNGNPPGEWQIWDRILGGGDLVFDAFEVGVGGEAAKLCVEVADANHAIELDSGSCVDLPTEAVAPAAWQGPTRRSVAGAATAVSAYWCGSKPPEGTPA